MRQYLAALLIAAFAFASPLQAQEKPKPIRALLVCGGCCHDYAKQKDILAKGLAERANIEVTIAYDDNKKERLNPVYEKADWAKDFDVIIHDECDASVKDENVIAGVLKPHKDGLPGVVLHCGMHSYRSTDWNKKGGVTPWFEFTGLQTVAHAAQLPISIDFTEKESPITKGMENWTTINEELYNNYNDGKLFPTAKPLARGKQTNKGKTDDYVVVWTNLYNDKAKVFCTTIGHNNATVADPRYLDLVTRGLLWSTGHLAEDGKPAAGYEAKK